MGAPRALALCMNFGGALEFQAGNWSEAEAGLRSAVELYRQVGSAAGESLSLQRLGVLLTARGEIDEAYQALADGLVVAERAAMRSHCLTRLHASMIRNRIADADGDGVKHSLADGREAMKRHGECITCNALLLPEVIRACIVLGNVEDAEVGARRLGEISERFDSHAWRAMACQSHGRVLLARGEADEAAAAFERARDDFGAVEQPYEAARCVYLLALAAARGAADRDGKALLAEAEKRFAELGAPGIEDRAR